MGPDSVVVNVDCGDAMVAWHSDDRGIVFQPSTSHVSVNTCINWNHAVRVNVTCWDLVGNAIELWSYSIRPIARPASRAPSSLLVPGMVVLTISAVAISTVAA